MSSGTNCLEVEVDDYCKIDANGDCLEEENIPDGDICTSFGENNKCKRVKEGKNCYFDILSNTCVVEDDNAKATKKCVLDYYRKNCLFMDKTCNDYSDNNCGNLGTKNGIQCTKLSSSGNCQEISIDNYCEIKNDYSCDKKEGQSFDDTKYKCDLINNKCQRREIKCEEKEDPTKCGEVVDKNCKAIHYQSDSSLSCRSVQKDEKCKIENGDCKDETILENYKKCAFTYNPDNIECKPIQKSCQECTSSCSNCQTSNTGYTCSQISENVCKEIFIHQSCQITPNDPDGTCSIKDTNSGKICAYNSDKTICTLVDSHCNYDGNTCSDKTDDNKPPTDKICYLDDIKNECGLRDKECSDLSIDACNDFGNKKCFKYNSKCLEYTIPYQYCEINSSGECKKKADSESNFGANEDCLFSYEISLETAKKVICDKKDKCTGSYTDCFSKSNSPNFYCIGVMSNEHYCRKIIPDDDCQVDPNQECVHKDLTNFDQKRGICAYDNESDKKNCKLRTRKCTDYTVESCGNLQNCVYYPDNQHCIETDDYCTISSGSCTKKADKNEIPYKKCEILNNICAQTDKACSEISVAQCNSTPKRENSQCFHFNDESNCKSIEIDEFCHVDSNGKCTNAKSITQYETCAFNNDKTECKIKQKQCSDYNEPTCGGFTPESKLCFYTGGRCSEIKVDSGCQINENNKCVPKGSGTCTLDNDNKKCSFKSSHSNSRYLSNLKYALLLVLFFIF